MSCNTRRTGKAAIKYVNALQTSYNKAMLTGEAVGYGEELRTFSVIFLEHVGRPWHQLSLRSNVSPKYRSPWPISDLDSFCLERIVETHQTPDTLLLLTFTLPTQPTSM